MTYFTVTATDLRTNRRVVIGGSDDRAKVEEFFDRDWPTPVVQYLYFFIDPAIHVDLDGFAHAIRVVERGQDPAQARLELAARGY